MAASVRHLPPAHAHRWAQPAPRHQARPKLIEILDELGYEEAWIGEHHSAGSELIASPEVFIATAAERTRRIKLGTGVSSLPYHQPLHARRPDGAARPPHRGPDDVRRRPRPAHLRRHDVRDRPTHPAPPMEEAFDVIMRAVPGRARHPPRRSGSPGGRLPAAAALHTDFDICVAASISPSGSKLAGKYGVGLLSIAATSPEGVEMLSGHWKVMEEQAADNGTPSTARSGG